MRFNLRHRSLRALKDFSPRAIRYLLDLAAALKRSVPHKLDTEMGRQLHERFGLSACEMTDEVFESEAAIVFTPAENRVHTIQAVLVTTLA